MAIFLGIYAPLLKKSKKKFRNFEFIRLAVKGDKLLTLLEG
jgi:hypothetical protein